MPGKRLVAEMRADGRDVSLRRKGCACVCVCECELDATGVALSQTCVCVCDVNLTLPVLPSTEINKFLLLATADTTTDTTGAQR